MKKYSVCVKVEMSNWFEVIANSEAEAAAKAKQAMDDIMEYNISYDTETEEVVFMGGSDTITVGEVNEANTCDICGREGRNNNAQPVVNGYCCDACNEMYVIPARIEAYIAAKKKNSH